MSNTFFEFCEDLLEQMEESEFASTKERNEVIAELIDDNWEFDRDTAIAFCNERGLWNNALLGAWDTSWGNLNLDNLMDQIIQRELRGYLSCHGEQVPPPEPKSYDPTDTITLLWRRRRIVVTKLRLIAIMGEMVEFLDDEPGGCDQVDYDHCVDAIKTLGDVPVKANHKREFLDHLPDDVYRACELWLDYGLWDVDGIIYSDEDDNDAPSS